MAIVFKCVCGRELHAKAEYAGKRIRCPACQAVVSTPAAPPPVAATSAGLTPAVDIQIPIDDAPPLIPAPPRIEVSAGLNDAAPTIAAPSENGADSEPLPEGVRQYKILTPKDMGFIAKFDAVRLEDAINKLAREGWAVKTAVALNLPGPTGMHEELIMILEK